MAEQINITADEPFQSFDVVLDGSSYTLELFWNDRIDSWHMSLFDALGEPIVQGVRIASSVPLLRDFVDVRLPSGSFVCLDTFGEDKDPVYDDFGEKGRCSLIYVSASEA